MDRYTVIFTVGVNAANAKDAYTQAANAVEGSPAQDANLTWVVMLDDNPVLTDDD